MERIILTANIGSASKKYALFAYDGVEAKLLKSAHYEQNTSEVDVYVDACIDFARTCISEGYLNDYASIEAVLMRVVAPGSFFQSHREMDEEYLAALEWAERVAPLHLHAQRKEYLKLRACFRNAKMYGISDSAFHATIPHHASCYAIPEDDARSFDIKKFGYHGLACTSVLARARTMLGELPARVIVCHLGGGASVTAILDGVSIDTSMGMTPFSGLIMATRAGDVDHGAIMTIMDRKGFNPEKMRDYLVARSGLVALGGSDDIRVLLEREGNGDERATRALHAYAYRIHHYIGAYAVALRGLDMIIMSGTVPERSAVMREKVLSDLSGLGVEFDQSKNNAHADSHEDGFIHQDISSVKLLVSHVDEHRAMILEYAKIQVL